MGLFSFLFPSHEVAARTSCVSSCTHCAPYIILDVETTGLNPTEDKIIQLSAIRYASDGTPVDFYDTYLNPGCHVPSQASQVNGITDEMLRNAPTADQVRDKFLSFIADDLLIGYNVTFDLRFLEATFPGSFSGRSYVDALRIARDCLNSPNYKLETVSCCIGFFPDDGFHDSFADCEAVAAILCHLREPLDPWTDCFRFQRSFRQNDTGGSSKFRPALKVNPRTFSPEELQIVSKHPLYQKNIVFTGELDLLRCDAAQMAADVGALVKTNVSSKTNYLVVGRQDCSLVGQDGLSTKQEKAYELNFSGKANINIICENEFLALLRLTEEA